MSKYKKHKSNQPKHQQLQPNSWSIWRIILWSFAALMVVLLAIVSLVFIKNPREENNKITDKFKPQDRNNDDLTNRFTFIKYDQFYEKEVFSPERLQKLCNLDPKQLFLTQHEMCLNHLINKGEMKNFLHKPTDNHKVNDVILSKEPNIRKKTCNSALVEKIYNEKGFNSVANLIDAANESNQQSNYAFNDPAGKNIIMAAVGVPNPDSYVILQKLLNDANGRYNLADLINQPDNLGRTALHIAAVNSHDLGIIKLLLEKGANVHLKDKQGKTPLDYTSLDKVQTAIALNEFGVASFGRDVNAYSDSMGYVIDLQVDGRCAGIQQKFVRFECENERVQGIYESYGLQIDEKSKSYVVNTLNNLQASKKLLSNLDRYYREEGEKVAEQEKRMTEKLIEQLKNQIKYSEKLKMKGISLLDTIISNRPPIVNLLQGQDKLNQESIKPSPVKRI